MSKNFAEQIAAIDTQIAKLNDKRAELVAEQAVTEKLASLNKGSKVKVRVGRGETAKIVEAEVLAVQAATAETPAKFKVIFGTGFDVDTVVVGVPQIVEVIEEVVAEEGTDAGN